MQYSKSIEDYLEAIYVIGEEKGNVRIKDIAELLNVKLPSVTEIVKRCRKKVCLNILPTERYILQKKVKALERKSGRNIKYFIYS